MNSQKENNTLKNKTIISLIGMMGSGKTTIGKKLAKKLDYYFFDSDQEIEDLEKQKIFEIFAIKGEKYFRYIESKIINELVNRDENMVISLGGGAFIDNKNQKILQDNSIIIWLDVNLDVIMNRIKSCNKRPLLKKNNNRVAIAELMEKRKEHYKKANLRIDNSYSTSEEVINRIVQYVKGKN